MICLLDRFFSSVIFSLSLPLAMYLSCSVKPLFCKATWYIGTDSVKTFLFNDIWHTFFYWFWQLFQYGCGVTGIFVDVNWIIIWLFIWLLSTRLSCASRKITIHRLAWIVILGPKSLNIFKIPFFLRSACGPKTS